MEDFSGRIVLKISIMAAVMFLAIQTGDVLMCLYFLRKIVYIKFVYIINKSVNICSIVS
jgi:hypothetical protein